MINWHRHWTVFGSASPRYQISDALRIVFLRSENTLLRRSCNKGRAAQGTPIVCLAMPEDGRVPVVKGT